MRLGFLASHRGSGVQAVLELGPRTFAQFAGRVLNVHPALLPRHGGAGMYGDAVVETLQRIVAEGVVAR